MAKKKELINHPQHYRQTNRKECIVEMEELYGTYITSIFCLTNAYKYLYRAGAKDGNSKEQDLAKAKWYYDWVKNKKMPLYEMIDIITEPREEQKLYLDLKNTFESEEDINGEGNC